MEPKIKILKAAIDLFSQRGFTATSLREIAMLASVNMAMINYYFISKDKVLENILDSWLSSVLVESQTIINGEDTEIDKMESIVNILLHYIFSNKQIALIYFQAQMTNSHPEVKIKLQKANEANYKNFEHLIQAGQKSNVFNKDISPFLFYFSLMGTIQQALVNMRTANSDFISKQDAKSKVSQHIKSLCRSLLIRD